MAFKEDTYQKLLKPRETITIWQYSEQQACLNDTLEKKSQPVILLLHYNVTFCSKCNIVKHHGA